MKHQAIFIKGEISFILFSSKSITSSYTLAKLQAVFLNAKVRPTVPCLVTKGLTLSQGLDREVGGGPQQESAIRGCVSSLTRSLKTKPTFCFIVLKKSGDCVCNVNHLVVSDSLWPHELQPSRLLCPWDFPGKNTGVNSHSLLQQNLPNSGIKPGSPALQADSLPSQPPSRL